MKLAEGELLREAKRMLPHLQREGAFAAQITDTMGGVFAAKNQWKQPLLRSPMEVVRVLCARECLVLKEEVRQTSKVTFLVTYRISPIGEKLLRRTQESDAPFQSQHQERGTRFIEEGDRTFSRHVVNMNESPLSWLRKRKGSDGVPLISAEEYEAGERLRDDFTRAQMTPRLTSDWSVGPTSQKQKRGPDQSMISDAAFAAKLRVENALDAVGPGLSEALIDVCCFLYGMEQMEQNNAWPKRSGKVVLKLALERLVDHYEMRPRPRRGGPVRVWHQGDEGG